MTNFTGFVFPYQFVSLLAMPVATVVILWTIIVEVAAGNVAYIGTMVALFSLLQLIATLFALIVDENDLWLCLYVPLVVVVYKHFIAGVTLKSLFDVLQQTDLQWMSPRDPPLEPTKTQDHSQTETNAVVEQPEVNDD